METMVSPSFQWATLIPIFIILGAAVLGLVVEAFVSRQLRRPIQIVLSFVGIGLSLTATVWRFALSSDISVSQPNISVSPPESSLLALEYGTLFEDGLGLTFQLIVLVCALLALFVIADRTSLGDGAFVSSAALIPGSPQEQEANEAGVVQTEIFPLTLFSVAGMMAFISAGDFLTLFVALELLSLPLYILTATARRRRALSQEAAIKYFLLGSFSSAFFLLGVAFFYGSTGSINILRIVATAMNEGFNTPLPLFIVATLLVLIGFLFKVGAVPFHSWTPDVYQGAPTPITGFMAAGTKIAAFAALLRFAFLIMPFTAWYINTVLWIIIVLTIVVGTVLGIIQKDVKRMLAYSSIAHTGFILIGVFSFQDVLAPLTILAAIAVYMTAYGLASVGAFGIVTLVREKNADGAIAGEGTKIEHWRGLGKTNKSLAIAMTIFLLSFAGIPLTAGFLGKFLVFVEGVKSGLVPLVVVAVLASAATAFFYFRLIRVMFFDEPDEDKTIVVHSEGMSIVAIWIAAILTLLIGIVPAPFFSFIL